MDRRVRGMSTSLNELDIKLLPGQQALARRMIRKLDELNDYKAIHDTLHGLQGETLNELGRISGRQILGVERRRSLGAQIMLLQAAAEKIGGKFADPGAPDLAATLRAMVVTAIQTIIKTLQKADPEARETPEAGAGMLRALLRQQMGPFDNKLVETVDEIPFADFAAMLTALPQAAGATATAPSGDPILAANVGASFEDIRSRLVRRRTVHTLWQQVEATLLNVEELLRGKGRAIELRAHWENLSGLVEQIGVLSVEQGLFTLPMPADADLTADEFAVKARSKDYRREFDFFAREARARFQWADNALLNDCETLERLQQPLRALVGDG
jgi:hypothetical protein